MSLAQLGILVATVLAADPSSRPEPLAGSPDLLASFPADQLEDVVLQALPMPPDKVVRETRYYGTVTVDHRAHLARRAKCITCHDPGPVSKLTFTPRVAHDRCIGCHREQAKGPTDCKGCHVKKPTPPPVQQTAAEPCPPSEPAKPPGPDPANLAAAFAAFTPREGAAMYGREPFHRALQFGVTAGTSQGASVRMTSHLDYIVVTQSVERLMSGSTGRTIGLLGAGISRPIHSGIALEAIGLAGFDAIDKPMLALLPALGLRTGLEWRRRSRWFQHMGVSVTAIADLTKRESNGREVGGASIYGTVATGFSIPPK
jgi:hypothetical protein